MVGRGHGFKVGKWQEGQEREHKERRILCLIFAVLFYICIWFVSGFRGFGPSQRGGCSRVAHIMVARKQSGPQQEGSG
jgi:hypothetical protein